jgi:hypothetical protein
MFPVIGEGEKPSLLYATVAMISYWLCLAALLSPEPSRCFKAHVPHTAACTTIDRLSSAASLAKHSDITGFPVSHQA